MGELGENCMMGKGGMGSYGLGSLICLIPLCLSLIETL